eukprot:Sspe_Gene.48440::Locus_25220_Transcript_1_1_Confidence_1.000_Length_631::g.48440::m.48440
MDEGDDGVAGWEPRRGGGGTNVFSFDTFSLCVCVCMFLSSSKEPPQASGMRKGEGKGYERGGEDGGGGSNTYLHALHVVSVWEGGSDAGRYGGKGGVQGDWKREKYQGVKAVGGGGNLGMVSVL